MTTECKLIAAIADAVPLFRHEALGVSLFYRADSENTVHACWREGKWLWTLHSKKNRLKGWGYAATGKEAMTMAMAAATSYEEVLAEEKVPA